ncbi:MAG: hypothetical protein U9N33_05375, partial [Campylobacterota bacterium]|nr:hypothetical protein [Campylobacterota bacterium]
MKKNLKFTLILLMFSATILVAKTQKLIATDHLVKDEIIKHDKVQSHVRTYAKDAGVGRFITIIPSLGRGVEDYTEKFNSTITTRLVEAGFRVILIQPRGVGKSRGDLTPANASMSM